MQMALKQKSIFVLNSQTERLESLYRLCSSSTSFYHSNGMYCTETPPAIGIYICKYSTLTPPPTGCVKDYSGNDSWFVVSAFSSDTKIPWEEVFYDSANNKNYVYIDRPKGIVGELQWKEQPVGSAGCNMCDSSSPNQADCNALDTSTGAVCLDVTLTYPKRWSANTAVDDSDKLGPQQSITVRTIVARAS